MRNKRFVICVLSAFLIITFAPNAIFALSLSETFETVADRLVDTQTSDGEWLKEDGYTGSIVAGLIQAYEVTEKAEYKAAAELGASFIIISAGGNFYGDEAYALARLSEITGDPCYADDVLNFYDSMDTHAYLRGFDETDPSNEVFYVAHHAMAAHMVGAADAEIWRQGLIQYLSQIDDGLAYYPVMSLGVATWALAQTGPMDDTLIDPFGFVGEPYWTDVKLSDLPQLLLSHQADSGGYAGSFYVRFDHDSPGEGYEASGYTEDTIYSVLGLIAADGLITVDETELDFDAEIQSAREALAIAVSENGFVMEHISQDYWSGGHAYYAFGGELLQTMQVIPEPDPE